MSIANLTQDPEGLLVDLEPQQPQSLGPGDLPGFQFPSLRFVKITVVLVEHLKAESAIEIATYGTQARIEVGEKSAGSLATFDGFTINHIVADPTRPDAPTKDRNQ